jgi:hypothetical protein
MTHNTSQESVTSGAVCAPGDDVVYERPSACPREGQIEPFDAGWHAHEVGLARETVRVLAADPGWALLGWDSREHVVRGAVS